MSATDVMVYIVDDEAGVREALAWLLRSRRLPSQGFDSARAFEQALDAAPPESPACILLDVRMPGMSGLALFDRLLERGIASAWPVIFLTGHASVATAVEAVKRGAFDFCEKPFSDNALVDRIERALAVSRQRVAQLGAQKPMLHSDQGVLYRCRAYRAQLAEAEITQSMSRKGNCWDNAPMESFFAVLKTECFHNRTFASIEALEAEIHEYIRYYNHERLSLKLKKLSPVAYRTQFATAA